MVRASTPAAASPSLLNFKLIRLCHQNDLLGVHAIIDQIKPYRDIIDLTSPFRIACTNNNLELAKLLYEQLEVSARDARAVNNVNLRNAFRFDRQELAEWIIDTFGMTIDDIRSCDNYILRRLVIAGNTRLADWLIDRFDLNLKDLTCEQNEAFRKVCIAGDIDTAKWMRSFGLSRQDAIAKDNEAFRKSCRNGHFEVAKWLVDEFDLLFGDIDSRSSEALRSIIALTMESPARYDSMLKWINAYYDKRSDADGGDECEYKPTLIDSGLASHN